MRPCRLVPTLCAALFLFGCARASTVRQQVPRGTGSAPSAAGRALGNAGDTAAAAATPALTAIHMTDAARGWGITASAVWRTADGGRTWTNVLTPAGHPPAGVPLAAGLLGPDTAWVVASDGGAVTVYRTTDGGQAWTHTSVAIANPDPALSADPVEQPRFVTFVDPTHGWLWVSVGPAMGGEAGTLLATSDGGAHWTAVSVAAPQGVPTEVPYLGIKSGVTFTSTTRGWFTVQATIRAPASLYATHDGGHHWTRQPLPLSVANADIVGLSPIAGKGAFSVLESRQGALSLAVVPTPKGDAAWNAGHPLASHTTGFFLSFADSEHGFATDGKSMFVTTDGGATWTSFAPNRPLQGVTQLDFVSQTLGFAIMPRPNRGDVVLSTTDGGHTWQAVSGYRFSTRVRSAP